MSVSRINFSIIISIYFLFFLCQVSAQKYIIDSSFGVNGSFEFTPVRSTSFGGCAINDQNQIYLFASDLLFYLDSTGTMISGSSRNNPDTFKNGSFSSYYNSFRQVSNETVFYALDKSGVIGLDINIRKVNINSIDDFTFSNLNTIELTKCINFDGLGYGQISDNYIVATSDYLPGGNFYKLKLFHILSDGSIDSIFHYLPDTCDLQQFLCQVTLTNIVEDSQGSLYLGYTFDNNDSLYFNLVKLKSDLKLNTDFGNNGFLRIQSTDRSNNLAYILQSTLLVDINSNLYLFLNNTSNLFIQKRHEDGSIDNNFGINGQVKFQFHNPNSRINRITAIYSKEQDEILFFLYNDSLRNSKFFGIYSNGKIDTEIEHNGGIFLNGEVISITKINEAEFLVLEASDLPSDRTTKLSKLIKNPISTQVNIKVNQKLDPIPNPFTESTIIKFPDKLEGQLKSIQIISLDGRSIKNLSCYDNFLKLNLQDINLSIFILKVSSSLGYNDNLILKKLSSN